MQAAGEGGKGEFLFPSFCSVNDEKLTQILPPQDQDTDEGGSQATGEGEEGDLEETHAFLRPDFADVSAPPLFLSLSLSLYKAQDQNLASDLTSLTCAPTRSRVNSEHFQSPRPESGLDFRYTSLKHLRI